MVLVFTLGVVAGMGSAVAADLTREQALMQLASKDAAARLAAVKRLHVIGRARDGTVLAKLLFDENDDNRSAAEAAMWAVWSRSGDTQIDALFKKGVAQNIVALRQLRAARARQAI